MIRSQTLDCWLVPMYIDSAPGKELTSILGKQAGAHLFFGSVFDLLVLSIGQCACQARISGYHDHDLGAVLALSYATRIDAADVVIRTLLNIRRYETRSLFGRENNVQKNLRICTGHLSHFLHP